SPAALLRLWIAGDAGRRSLCADQQGVTAALGRTIWRRLIRALPDASGHGRCGADPFTEIRCRAGRSTMGLSRMRWSRQCCAVAGLISLRREADDDESSPPAGLRSCPAPRDPLSGVYAKKFDNSQGACKQGAAAVVTVAVRLRALSRPIMHAAFVEFVATA